MKRKNPIFPLTIASLLSLPSAPTIEAPKLYNPMSDAPDRPFVSPGSSSSSASRGGGTTGITIDERSGMDERVTEASMQRRRWLFVGSGVIMLALLIAVIALGVKVSNLQHQLNPPTDPNVVEIVFIHVNDIYELNGVSGGSQGTISRLSTLKKQYLSSNPNTKMILAGDLLSPSAMSAAQFNGQKLAGAQMVDAFNAAGLDYATFGNHEFDLSQDDFRKRVSESQFVWFNGNVLNATTGQRFNGCPEFVEFDTPVGGVKIGMFAITIDTGTAVWANYSHPPDAVAYAVSAANRLRARGNDLIIGVTHQDLTNDILLASQASGQVDIIMAGHGMSAVVRSLLHVCTSSVRVLTTCHVTCCDCPQSITTSYN